MTSLVECIPNFSTARPEVLDQIVAALKAVPEIQLLDRTSDVDHNRSVLTFVGPSFAVEEAAFQVIRKAAILIDLNQHKGVHPRIGAADVVPFVPLTNTTLEECVAMARRLGARVGAELQIPVYLYESAAMRPERVKLENVRKGQYVGLKTEITNPERAPDFGPAWLGPAGAVAIGARMPLIAFNVYLTTNKLEIAEKIAKTIRASSGGLPHVKALGLLVGGRAQVSMNLTNFHETSVQLAVETIRSEANLAGVDIHHSELIGLIPQAALTDAAASYLHLNGFTPDRVLENRIQPTQPAAAPVNTPKSPVAIAASSAAMAAGLVVDVAEQTLGKPKYAEAEAEMKSIRARASSLRDELAQSIRDDAAALEKITAAFKRHSANKADLIEQAALEALQVPLGVARRAVEIMHLADRCALLGSLSTIAEAAAAVSLARGALIAVGYNIRINADALQKKSNGEPAVFEVDALEARAARINRQTRHTLRERAGLKLE